MCGRMANIPIELDSHHQSECLSSDSDSVDAFLHSVSSIRDDIQENVMKNMETVQSRQKKHYNVKNTSNSILFTTVPKFYSKQNIITKWEENLSKSKQTLICQLLGKVMMTNQRLLMYKHLRFAK